MELYEKLYKLRKDNGYSQEELSIKLNVSRQTISKWENGFAVPDSKNLITIASFFNIDVNELVNDENIPKKTFCNKNIKSSKILKKVIILLVVLLFLIILLLFIYTVIKRYMIVDNMSKNLAYIYLQDNNSFMYSQNDLYTNTVTSETNYSYENSYCKDNILKKEYYEVDSDINRLKNEVKLVRIEYRDNLNYYDINPETQTYEKTIYDSGTNLYYNFTAANLDFKIYSEFNYMSNFKEKLLLALNLNYEITILNGNDETNQFYSMKKVSKDNKESVVLKSSVYSSNYFLDLEITAYNDDLTQCETTTYTFSNNVSEIEDNITLIDLSNYEMKN